MKNLYERNHYRDPHFPFEIYQIQKNKVTPPGRGFGDIHWHEELQFTMVKTGKINAKINGLDYQLKAGEAIFINHDILHQMTALEEGSSYISLNFPKELLGFFPGSRMALDYVTPFTAFLEFPAVLIPTAEAWQQKLLQHIKKIEALYFAEHFFAWEYELALQLCQIWYLLLGSGVFQAKAAVKKIKDSHYDRLLTMIQFIHQNFAENLHLTAIAASANISASEANRLFKTYTALTPYKFLLDYRLQKSCELLTLETKNMTEIALEVGFADTSHFIQVFKKKYGTTPKNFRQQSKVGN